MHAVRSTDDSEEQLRRWHRWGWLPLVGGGALLAMMILAGWEILLRANGISVDANLWWTMLARGLSLAAAIAGWAGWFVWRSLRRIDAARASFQARQAQIDEQARRTERLAEMGALTRELAHEIRNPLNSLSLNTRLLGRSLGGCPTDNAIRCHRLVEIQESEIKRLDQLVEDYLTCGQASTTLNRTRVSWGGLVEEVLAVHRGALAEHQIALDVSSGADLPSVWADPGRLKQVIHNLIRNEIEALSPGGKVQVVLENEGKVVCLTVTDDGPGFSQPASVFRPFYTTKATGHGLGLAVVSDVIRAHGGEVSATNATPQGGARIAVRLPIASSP